MPIIKTVHIKFWKNVKLIYEEGQQKCLVCKNNSGRDADLTSCRCPQKAHGACRFYNGIRVRILMTGRRRRYMQESTLDSVECIHFFEENVPSRKIGKSAVFRKFGWFSSKNENLPKMENRFWGWCDGGRFSSDHLQGSIPVDLMKCVDSVPGSKISPKSISFQSIFR